MNAMRLGFVKLFLLLNYSDKQIIPSVNELM